MNLIRLNSGFIVALGFNLHTHMENPRIVSWITPAEASNYDWCEMPYDLTPEFVRSTDTGLIAFQPGRLMEMSYIGGPHTFSFRHYKPDET